MPRGIAFALASYALGIVFALVTMLVGFAIASLLGVVQTSLWSFLDTVLRAETPSDFVVFPLKMLAIGLLIGATGCMTALSAHADDDEILRWLKGFKTPPRTTFITHGEPSASDALRKRIEEELGWTCVVPDHGQQVDLS